ncbi:MAG TPA: hypothetical protein VGP72_33240 [Planctomycetota bacterium]|jgi:hypothetical protein
MRSKIGGLILKWPRTALGILALATLATYACVLLEHRERLATDRLIWLPFIARQFGALLNLFLIVLHGGLLIATGLAPLRWVLQRRKLAPTLLLPLCLVFAALVSYMVFWPYVLNSRLGHLVSLLVLAVSVRELFVGRKAFRDREAWVPALRWSDTWLPLLLMFLTASMYVCMLTAFQNEPPNYFEAACNRFMHRLPSDHMIPWIFANRLWRGEETRIIFEDWLSSDRPPLQTCLVLVQRPVRLLAGDNFSRQYQVLATLLQCMWVPAVWSLCRALCFSVRRSLIVVLACLSSGFFFVNSIFVWPKLLAASLLVFSIVFLLPSLLRRKPLTAGRATAAATAAMLAFLAHGGAAFTILALLLLGIPLALRSVKSVAIASAFALLLYAPWAMYQKFYAPPGDRLLRWHLAGVENDKSPRTFGQVLREQYISLTLSQWKENKLANLRRLCDMPAAWTISGLRESQFFGLFPALDVVCIGLILAIAAASRRCLSTLSPGPRTLNPAVNWLLTIAIGSLAVWIVLMFEPASTINHQNSYATLLLLFVIGAGALTRLPTWLCSLLLALHFAVFAVLWLFSTPAWPLDLCIRRLNVPMALCSLTLLIFLSHFCLKGWRNYCWKAR